MQEAGDTKRKLIEIKIDFVECLKTFKNIDFFSENQSQIGLPNGG